MPPTGETKPMANSTRSALSSNSEPGTSIMRIWPLSSLTHSTRQATRVVTLPSRPSKRLVDTAQSRSQPSSCDEEVRSLSGQ